MGSPKPLLPWGDGTLIEYQVRQLREAGADPVIAVVGHRAGDVSALAKRAGAAVVINDRYAEGRSSSVIAGAKAVPTTGDAVLVLSVDEPRPSWILKRLLDEHLVSGAPITRPTHEGEEGHPPVISTAILGDLLTLREATEGLRGVMARYAADINYVDFDTPLVLLGMNTPEEYDAARAAYPAL